GERRPQVRGEAAEGLARLVRTLRDRAAHADAGDVREPRLLRPARPRAVLRPAEIDGASRAPKSDANRFVELVRDPVGAREVDPGPARDYRELDRVDFCDPVHELVHGPVTTHRDDELRASGCSFPRYIAILFGLVVEG